MKKNPSLDFLKKREKQLKSDIQKIGIELEEKRHELSFVQQSIDGFVSHGKKKGSYIFPTIAVPAEYNKDLRWEDKIGFVLNTKEDQTLNEICKEIASLEGKPTGDTKVIYPTIQQTILRMINDNKLIKHGDYRSKYKLNIKK